jgi:oligogalacturonide lyase
MLAIVQLFLASPATSAQGAVPSDWIDPATGHRIIRLSPDSGGQSLYFHQNPYTETGDKLFITSKGGSMTVDLTTLGRSPCKVEKIAEGNAGQPVVGKKTRTVYYSKGGSIYATHLDTHVTRQVVKFPPGYTAASGLALNADETLLASTGKTSEHAARPKDLIIPTPTKWSTLEGTYDLRVLFTVNVTTGEIKNVWTSKDWLNHTQFSPTDPKLILFCHEGTWDLVDRIWTIRTDGTGLKRMHTRSMARELFGHEFFSFDGKCVLYDLQTPRSTEFNLGSVNIETGERIRYRHERSEWSVHYNQSHDGKLFSGDGGGPNSVANRRIDGKQLDGPGNGQWIYLFRPSPTDKMETIRVNDEDVKVGRFAAEKLADLSKHKYTLEPNNTFTPDNKWIVFRSNMHGPTHVYAVEVEKADSIRKTRGKQDLDPKQEPKKDSKQ